MCTVLSIIFTRYFDFVIVLFYPPRKCKTILWFSTSLRFKIMFLYCFNYILHITHWYLTASNRYLF